VVVEQKPSHSKEQSDKLKNMSDSEKREVHCGKYGPNIAKSECLYRSDFTTLSTFAFDLSANIQITNDILSLINYRAHSFPKKIIIQSEL